MLLSPPAAGDPALRDTILEAWQRRHRFDLRGVGYGRIHWGNKTDMLTRPLSYYYFLAGFVNTLGIQNIIEIGTHQGGSAMALAAGMSQPGRIVTLDVTADGEERFREHPIIRAHRVDANTERALDVCTRELEGRGVDLIYIDAEHAFWPTLLSFLVYSATFGPAHVILDDITLNDGMRKAWAYLQARLGENAIDATEIAPDIRPAEPTSRPGFGVVRLARPSVPECH